MNSWSESDTVNAIDPVSMHIAKRGLCHDIEHILQVVLNVLVKMTDAAILQGWTVSSRQVVNKPTV